MRLIDSDQARMITALHVRSSRIRCAFQNRQGSEQVIRHVVFHVPIPPIWIQVIHCLRENSVDLSVVTTDQVSIVVYFAKNGDDRAMTSVYIAPSRNMVTFVVTRGREAGLDPFFAFNPSG